MANRNIGIQASIGPLRSTPMTSDSQPHWKTATRMPYAAPTDSRFMTTALSGTRTLRNTTISKMKLRPFVVWLSFIVLMVAVRSILVPLKAVIMNLLSVGAAYGILVAVFQWGWLSDVIGVDRSGPTSAWIPMFLFAIVFGLSMDYEVFLLSRIKEEYDRTVRGARRTTPPPLPTGWQSTARGHHRRRAHLVLRVRRLCPR